MHRLIINLKQCPACNGTNQEIYPNGYVSCDCGFLTKSVDVWNTRSDTDFLTRLREAVGEIEDESINGVAPAGVFNYDDVWQDSADKCWRIMQKYFKKELEDK